MFVLCGFTESTTLYNFVKIAKSLSILTKLKGVIDLTVRRLKIISWPITVKATQCMKKRVDKKHQIKQKVTVYQGSSVIQWRCIRDSLRLFPYLLNRDLKKLTLYAWWRFNEVWLNNVLGSNYSFHSSRISWHTGHFINMIETDTFY